MGKKVVIATLPTVSREARDKVSETEFVSKYAAKYM